MNTKPANGASESLGQYDKSSKAPLLVRPSSKAMLLLGTRVVEGLKGIPCAEMIKNEEVVCDCEIEGDHGSERRDGRPRYDAKECAEKMKRRKIAAAA
jgi:hypothetical protein